MAANFEKLVLNLKKDDAAAFKEIFDAFYERLYAFSFKYVQNDYVAEEIVENMMIMVWEKRKVLDKIKDFKSYLYTSVKNASLDYLKIEKKNVSIDKVVYDSDVYFYQNVLEEETHKVLIDALNSLPEKCRKVFELCCLEGLKYKDVAEDLQISVNTVKSQRARAIELLKEKLKNTSYYSFILSFL